MVIPLPHFGEPLFALRAYSDQRTARTAYLHPFLTSIAPKNVFPLGRNCDRRRLILHSFNALDDRLPIDVWSHVAPRKPECALHPILTQAHRGENMACGVIL